MNLLDQFNQKLSWLAHAIIEDKEGRLPNSKELERNMTIKHENGQFKIMWRGQYLCGGSLKQEGDIIQGEWDMPEKYFSNEIIMERLQTWNK